MKVAWEIDKDQNYGMIIVCIFVDRYGLILYILIV